MIPLSREREKKGYRNPSETRRNRVILSFLRCGLIGQVEAKGEAVVAARSTRVPPPVPLRITIVFPSRCCSRACVDANGQAAPAAAELAFPRAHEDLSFPFRATRENSLFHSRTYSLLLEDSRQFRRHVYRRKKLIRTKYRPEKDAHNSYAE